MEDVMSRFRTDPLERMHEVGVKSSALVGIDVRPLTCLPLHGLGLIARPQPKILRR